MGSLSLTVMCDIGTLTWRKSLLLLDIWIYMTCICPNKDTPLTREI